MNMLDAVADDDPIKMIDATKNAFSVSYKMAKESEERDRRRGRYKSRSLKEDLHDAKQAVEVSGKILKAEMGLLDALFDAADWLDDLY